MMKDDIFFGNLMGLLRTGKWNVNAEEAAALIQIIQEVDRRRKPPVVAKVEEPVVDETKTKKVKHVSK